MTSDQIARHDKLKNDVIDAARVNALLMLLVLGDLKSKHKTAPSQDVIDAAMLANGGDKTLIAVLDASVAMVNYEATL